jgi:alkylation response protein AidB-like acyl-CoA dehydrogenase
MADSTAVVRPASDAEIRARLATALDAVNGLAPGDAYNPAIPAALTASGLHLLCLPAAAGGLGGGMAAAVEILSALGALDGSTGLGFAMHTHVVGALADSDGWSAELRRWLEALVVDEAALLNAASTEEGSGSPARGGLPGTLAVPVADGYQLTGEKTWTSWLPALRAALVTATVAGGRDEVREDRPAAPDIGLFLVDLASPGVEREERFDALGMRGSASGRLRLNGVFVPRGRLIVLRRPRGPDPRGSAPAAWFAAAIGAVYLGIGEGARREVTRWAIERRPGDGSVAVADLPTVALRLGRLDAALRVARIVLEDVARRWDATSPVDRPALMPDLILAKVTATDAAVLATDEALRIAGGPGFMSGKLERAQRDARAGLINPPLDDLALQGFARNLVDQAREGG